MCKNVHFYTFQKYNDMNFPSNIKDMHLLFLDTKYENMHLFCSAANTL